MGKKTKKSIELSEPILCETFGLTRVYEETQLLKEWLNAEGALDNIDDILLQRVMPKLIENADSWNEEELKMQFISMIILLANFEKPLKTYFDREISAEKDGILIKTEADMLVSKGIGEMIKTPYFFLHEYKREKKYSGDPMGQMLGGMLISQVKNSNQKPVYGCYVQGRYWFFSILLDKEYIISTGFDSSVKEGAVKIIMILRKLNQIIIEKLMD
ncbi:MAG: hypothetical protein MUE81_12605 [Thermoflexibacter sp.]|jgi:hypothetical protein|nr:hypothetical protein [Thermoflexibacter sp.]